MFVFKDPATRLQLADIVEKASLGEKQHKVALRRLWFPQVCDQ